LREQESRLPIKKICSDKNIHHAARKNRAAFFLDTNIKI